MIAKSTGTIAWCVGVGLALVAGVVAGSYVELRWMGQFGERYLADLRRRLLAHLHALDLDYFSHEPSGRVVARLTSDVEGLQEFLQQGLSLLLRGILLLVLTIVVMFTQSWQLTLATLAILPVLAVAGRWYRPRAYDVQMGYRESMADMLNHVNEALVGMRVVQAYRNETPQRRAFAGVNDATYDARRLSGSITARFYAVIEFMNPVALAIIIGYGAVLADRNEMQVGTVIAFTLLLTRLFEPIEQFIELTSLLQTAGAAFSRTFAFLGRVPALVDAPAAAEFDRGPGRVELDGRHVPLPRRRAARRRRPRSRDRARRADRRGRHQRGRQVDAGQADRPLLRPHARVDPHRRSGSARRAIVVAAAPRRGRARRRGSCSTARSRATSRSGDRAQPAPRSSRPAARSASSDAIDRIPGGLDAAVANRGLTLSSGQRQLVALARAFLADPGRDRARRGDVEPRSGHRRAGGAGTRASCSPDGPRS